MHMKYNSFYLCKATFGYVVGKEQLVVHVRGGGGRLGLLSRLRG